MSLDAPYMNAMGNVCFEGKLREVELFQNPWNRWMVFSGTCRCGVAHRRWIVSLVIIWNLRFISNISVVMLNNGHPPGGGNVACKWEKMTIFVWVWRQTNESMNTLIEWYHMFGAWSSQEILGISPATLLQTAFASTYMDPKRIFSKRWLAPPNHWHPPWNQHWHSTWKWMVGIRSFLFGLRPIFRGKLTVGFSGCTYTTSSKVHPTEPSNLMTNYPIPLMSKRSNQIWRRFSSSPSLYYLVHHGILNSWLMKQSPKMIGVIFHPLDNPNQPGFSFNVAHQGLFSPNENWGSSPLATVANVLRLGWRFHLWELLWWRT